MEIMGETSEILAELDALRISRGMSYQAVADACGVSKSTVHRTLAGLTEPTVQLIQSIAAAVQYKPKAPEIVPNDFTQEAYIAYLKEVIQRQSIENDRRVRQLHAHYNMLRRQDRRTIVVMGAILGVLVLFICGLFVYDFAHLDRGWIQMYAAGLIQRWERNLTLAVRLFGGAIWNA